eukprot:jgi/Chrzof1/4926/Cz15g04220.t1
MLGLACSRLGWPVNATYLGSQQRLGFLAAAMLGLAYPQSGWPVNANKCGSQQQLGSLQQPCLAWHIPKVDGQSMHVQVVPSSSWVPCSSHAWLGMFLKWTASQCTFRWFPAAVGFLAAAMLGLVCSQNGRPVNARSGGSQQQLGSSQQLSLTEHVHNSMASDCDLFRFSAAVGFLGEFVQL